MMIKQLFIFSIIFASNLIAQAIIDVEHNTIKIEYLDKINWQTNDRLEIFRGKKHIGYAKITKISNPYIYAIITQENSMYKIKKGDFVKECNSKKRKTSEYKFINQRSSINIGMNFHAIDIFDEMGIGYRIGFSFVKKSKSYLYIEPTYKQINGILKDKIFDTEYTVFTGTVTYKIHFFELPILYRYNFRLFNNNFFINLGPSLNICTKAKDNLNYYRKLYTSYDNPQNQNRPKADYHTNDDITFPIFNSHIGINAGLGMIVKNIPIELRYSSTVLRDANHYIIDERTHEISMIIIFSKW